MRYLGMCYSFNKLLYLLTKRTNSVQKAIRQLFLPSFEGYKRRSLKKDFLAALVVTAIAIPESLGFAVIVGLPIQTGLYCALLAPIVFALFTSSRHLVIGADSATAALVASGAATVAAAHTPEFAGAVALLGVLTGLILLAMSALRLGFLADLISKPVLVGFLSGVGAQLLLGKLPEMLGVEAEGGLLVKLLTLASQLGNIHWPTAVMSVSVLLVIALAGKYKLPGALFGLVLAAVATKFFQLPAYGIEVVGHLPEGLPRLVLPSFSWPEMVAMFSSALAIAIVILAQSSATIRSFAAEHDEAVQDNKDLMALGFANIASAVTQGFAVNGSPPRTSAAHTAGGRSQMVNIFMATFIGFLLLFATGLLAIVPEAALAAVVCSIGLHLIKIDQLKDIWHTHKAEFGIALLALVAVALLGVQQGVMIAVLASLVERLRREYRPYDDILLRDRIIDSWAADRIKGSHKITSRPAGMLIYHFDSDLFFENATFFSRRMKEAIAGAKDPVTCVILDAGSMSNIDYTGVEALKRIFERLIADNVRCGIAHVSPGLRKMLDTYGVTELIGTKSIYGSLREAVRSQPNARRSTVRMVRRLKLPVDSYVVIGGGVLETLGLRDTMDVDLVVNKEQYRRFHDKGWREYIHDDGKRILTHRGYNIMTSYMGMDVQRLRRNAFVKDDVYFMGLDDLIKSKEALGRTKDLQDAELIREYQRQSEEE